ncbi:type II secretion system protein GspL [Variovorax sp. CY25R-8]|uniref:type II secretion system protein GspL n=1 Tax=Variovorax sp. CY25R-8 TaxID=2855501 RepID=UPI0021BBAA13|nr:type II secretion system protein GspL [Variovorax sp. CY25R-8]MCT8175731.1 hypothetical protein [Variovorax sp. CY25R-8]
MRRVDALRLMLPRARDLESSPLRCAWRSGEGAWQAELLDGLPAVARRFQPRHVEACLHPADVSMAQVELPPLAPRRQRIAVLGAIELLALGPAGDLAVGFGARNAEGRAPVAWMSAHVLARLVQALKDHGVVVNAVLPPPAFLPAPEDGLDDAVAATIVDDWVIARTGVEEGIACPLPQGRADAAQIEARVKPHLPEARPLRLLAADAPAEDGQSMGGGGWRWSLPVGHAAQAGTRRPWLLPLAGWTAAALAVWLVGLNLYAARIAAQGQTLTRQMAAQVKAAYPEVPVILNPLQQARQLRDARRAGAAAGSPEAGSFAALMRASTGLLTQAKGQVQRLEFRDDRLEVRWRDGAAPSADEMKSLQDRALQHGLALAAEPGGLRIQAGAVEPRAASAAGASR